MPTLNEILTILTSGPTKVGKSHISEQIQLPTFDQVFQILELILNSWPVLVLVLAIMFKTEIRALIARLRRAALPGGGAFDFGDASVDQPSQETPAEEKAESVAAAEQLGKDAIKWNSYGNLYWTGHDLMWTIDVLLRGAPRETIVHGLRQSLHHLRSLGFSGTPLESRLARLKADAEKTLEKDWTLSLRNIYAGELRAIADQIGAFAKTEQSDFKSRPEN